MDELTREFLIETQEGLDRMERGLTDLEDRPGDAELLAEIFRSVHTIKGTSGFLGFRRLEKLTHSGENLLGLLREGKATADAEMVTTLLHLLDRLRSILGEIEKSGTDGEADDSELIAELDALVETAQVGCLTAQAGGSIEVKAHGAAYGSSAVVKDVAPRVELPEKAREPEPAVTQDAGPKDFTAQNGTSAAETTLRVDIALLNRMMNLVGELVLTRNQVLQATAADTKLTLLSQRLDKVTADLRESVMRARMQPVSNLFSKVPRIVRDVSRVLGRRVRLEMSGQDTELDKSLLEAIKDPLTHAVRNALDHGIETAEERLAAGKPAEGMLKLRAYQEASHVIVEVADDGAGICVDKVRMKAVERELISAERAALLSERELLQLIFLPGFSTAESITSVSGRGVGMDVVRTNVEKIGGKVEIESRRGDGTTLRMRIPLTLAIIPALIVRSAGQSFAVPQGALSELLQTGDCSAAIEWFDRTPVLRLRNHLLPLVFLDALLSADEERAEDKKKRFIAVLEADGRRYGLVVDGLADPEEIVVKPLDEVLKQIGVYSGATVLGNGELALILDPGAVASRAEIGLRQEEETSTVAIEADDEEYLVVELGGRRAGIPVSEVLRIRRVSLSQIDYAENGPVLRFERELLPVEDPASLLASSDKNRQVEIVIYRSGRGQAGIAVDQVFNVSGGTKLFDAGTLAKSGGVLLIDGHVTRLMRSEANGEGPEEKLLSEDGVYAGAEA